MVFLAVLFVEQADQMLRSRQFSAWKVIPVLLIAAALFTVRTPLGFVAILALVFSLVMSSTILPALKAERKDQGGGQQTFAKYAGAAVFAPMIFTLPFPTMVRPFEGQEVQQLNHGGNFIKNIISAFTIFAMVMLLMSGRWREHLLPLSFVLGYLVVLSLSAFAQSERFHQPTMPLEFMFAAYGLSIAVTKQKYKRWFTYWCALMFVAAVAWNWFKLAGRGLM